MPKLDEFVAPKPWPAFSRFMNHVNRTLMLHGLPLLRDLPGLNQIPGIRGLTGIRRIVADEAEFAQLKTLCATDAAVFLLPNHPEFFTDWMLDKDIIARCAPEAASWATNGVVNGMGSAMQKFWLWNNLIAQIPGDSMSAKNHSVQWALKGKGVLLHPEGMVGWHSNHVAALMPGAADMAKQARSIDPDKPAWLVPIVWKLVFEADATAGLAREAAYIEKRLGLSRSDKLSPAERAHAIYTALIERELAQLGLKVVQSMPLHQKLETVQTVLSLNLASWLGDEVVTTDCAILISKVRKHIKTFRDKLPDDAREALSMADRLQRHRRLGAFAFENGETTQEETAEHLKRLRNDWCKGTLRDTINSYLPQPVTTRTAVVRILPPVAVNGDEDSAKLMETVRKAMQSALDDINRMVERGRNGMSRPNPFFSR